MADHQGSSPRVALELGSVTTSIEGLAGLVLDCEGTHRYCGALSPYMSLRNCASVLSIIEALLYDVTTHKSFLTP